MDHEAFFISPEGQMHFVPGRHIELVCARPEVFGLGNQELDRHFTTHGEERGTEGEARQVILAGLMEKGWIRIRVRSEARRGLVCLFQLGRLNDDAQARITAFTRDILSERGAEGVRLEPHTLAVIKLVSGEEITDGWTTLGQISRGSPDAAILFSSDAMITRTEEA